MVYSDTTNLNGVIQTVERLADLGQTYFSGDATRLKEITAMINNENHRIWAFIFNSTGNWQYDDGNYTNLPQSASDLVSGTGKYALPTEALTIIGVNCKDTNGEWYPLTPLTNKAIDNQVDGFLDDNGTPEYYKVVNGTVQVFPAPNYNSTGGFKVLFDRDSVDFTTSDTTKTPGFASPYHEWLPLKTTITWLEIKQPQSPSLAAYRLKDQKFEIDVKKFYSARFKDYKPHISRERISYK